MQAFQWNKTKKKAMVKAHNTEIRIPGVENIIYNSINMNFAVQLIDIRINSIKKMQKISNLVVNEKCFVKLALHVLLSASSKYWAN